MTRAELITYAILIALIAGGVSPAFWLPKYRNDRKD